MKIVLTINQIIAIGIVILFALVAVYVAMNYSNGSQNNGNARFWDFQAIDTMKYSRDLSREKLNDLTFDITIERQIKQIADTGATHVGIATPYDDEFLPVMKRWVKYARQYNLKVWFRGNFSGWEGWFEYKKIGREEHLTKTKAFILGNASLFQNGDVFSACPECENGGPGDPRHNGDADGHKQFLIDEYEMTKKAFRSIKKDVTSNYLSMNGDVAKLIMTPEVTKKIDGVVTVDHYVTTPEKLAVDVDLFASNSNGNVVLGEFGAPIPDINGEMSEDEQAEWIAKTGKLLTKSKNLEGLSYWVNLGGSTKLWNDDGSKRKAVDALTSIYKPTQLHLTVVDAAGQGIKNARVVGVERYATTTSKGQASLPYIDAEQYITVEAENYKAATYKLAHLLENRSLVLEREYESPIFKLKKFLKKVFPFI